MDLSNVVAIAEGISKLLYPHGEVVLHDLATGCIAAIFNPLSKRKVGDESLIEEIDHSHELPTIFPVYFKTNWDGKKMKSISITLRDSEGCPLKLLCINLDLSKWEEMHRLLSEWIEPLEGANKPESLFKDDWREKINVYVADYLKKEGTSLKTLTKDKMKRLVHALYGEGAFQAKNAAAYIADVLDISRATIYNYLRS